MQTDAFYKYSDTQNAEGGIFKYLGDQLRKEPGLRCSVTEECMERVRKGSSVYTQVAYRGKILDYSI